MLMCKQSSQDAKAKPIIAIIAISPNNFIVFFILISVNYFFTMKKPLKLRGGFSSFKSNISFLMKKFKIFCKNYKKKVAAYFQKPFVIATLIRGLGLTISPNFATLNQAYKSRLFSLRVHPLSRLCRAVWP